MNSQLRIFKKKKNPKQNEIAWKEKNDEF